MGKGDIKTRRGKLFRGSYGVLRPRKRKVRGIPGPEMAQLKETVKKEKPPNAREEKKAEPEVVEEINQETPDIDQTPDITDKTEKKAEAKVDSAATEKEVAGKEDTTVVTEDVKDAVKDTTSMEESAGKEDKSETPGVKAEAVEQAKVPEKTETTVKAEKEVASTEAKSEKKKPAPKKKTPEAKTEEKVIPEEKKPAPKATTAKKKTTESVEEKPKTTAKKASPAKAKKQETKPAEKEEPKKMDEPQGD